MMSAVSAASSARPLGALRCVDRCCPRTRHASRSDTPNMRTVWSMQRRRRAGLTSFPMRLIAETPMKARASMLDQIKVLDRRLMAVAKTNPTARLFMTVPGVGVITALSVASSFDDMFDI